MDFPLHIPFVEHLGVQLCALGDGRAELLLDVQPHQTNNQVMAHGGIVMTLLDVAMAHAARTVAAAGASGAAQTSVPTPSATQAAHKQLVVTIEMKTSFMRPSHGRLRAVGTLLQRTASMAFCEGSIFDADGRLCAHATGTFKYLRPAATQPPPTESTTT